MHTHNVTTRLAGLDQYRYEPTKQKIKWQPDRRRPRSWGIDVPTAASAPAMKSGFSARWVVSVARRSELRAWRRSRFAGRVDGVYAFPHQFGCSQLGGDLDRTRKLIAALARHPNAGGVLILGLGCESNQLDKLLADIPAAERQHIRAFSAQSTSDETEEGLRAVEDLVQIAERSQREPCPLSALTVGLKCGGSDGFSGITANPLVGRIADRVTAAGGSAILTEIPEVFGAEHLLMQRAADERGVRRHRGCGERFQGVLHPQSSAGA